MAFSNNTPTKAHADVYRLVNGVPVHAVRVRLDAGRVTVTGDPDLVAELNAGITDPLTGQALTVGDGWAFIAALSGVYRSPYLYATDASSDA